MKRRRIRTDERPQGSVPFGNGTIAVSAGIVMVRAPANLDHHFPLSRGDALAWAAILASEAPRLAKMLREASAASSRAFGGARTGSPFGVQHS